MRAAVEYARGRVRPRGRPDGSGWGRCAWWRGTGGRLDGRERRRGGPHRRHERVVVLAAWGTREAAAGMTPQGDPLPPLPRPGHAASAPVNLTGRPRGNGGSSPAAHLLAVDSSQPSRAAICA
jgi:hypothetical protein